MENYLAKFMCSYGGEIQPRTHDNKLFYVGGHNKILYVDRSIKFSAMLADLSALFDGAGVISFKYQLPGKELDYLVSVTNDNDLHDMMIEYDKLYRASARSARMRLFLFPNSHLDVDPTSPQPDPVKANSDVDFPLSLDNGAVVPPPLAAVKFHDPAPEPLVPPPAYRRPVSVNTSDPVVGSDLKVNHPEVQRPLQRVVDCASSPSSRLFGSSTPVKYDVFISFRGDDIRTNFTGHLVKALSRKQIETFADDRLHKEDDISPSHVRAIENSYVSVVVFSENYASSKWCLEELVKILDCRKKHRQAVIPVFYNVDPSHVRKQVGIYKEAFEKHLLNMNKILKWKDALTEAADLAGWDSRCCRNDSELTEKIIKGVLQKLNYHYPPNESLVGIDKNSAPLESLLREAPLIIGVWGMGGIGKTTIATTIYRKLSRQYEGSCFLENVRERAGKYEQGLHNLRNQLYSDLLEEKMCQNSTEKSTFVECRLPTRRYLVVLDDVSSSEQLEYLTGELHCYGPGSKIIITTRDKSVLENRRVEKIYEVKALDFQESLKLFSLKAFSKDYPKRGYEELSRKAVVDCKGIPLALIVLGSFLFSKSETEWENELQKLKKIPDEEIQNGLKLSYDGLDYQEKQIFLDIACFFKGELNENVVNLLDRCGFHAAIGMRSLHDKALITLSDNDRVEMHDLLQEMGQEIVYQESIKNPENRSRLWSFDDIRDVLENNKGTDTIEGIMLDMSQSRKYLCMSADTFTKMPNLRFFKVVFSSNTHGKLCDLRLPMGLESFPDKLRYLEWHKYPLQSLPSNFCPQKLVALHMPKSQIKQLWNGVQNLVNLKEVNLTGCQELVELPDFSKASNLITVDLSNCISLHCVHPSILSLGKLERLNLFNCVKLEMLESRIHSRSLKHLKVDGCSSLMKFALSSEEIRRLDLSQTRVKVLHSSIGRFSKVKEIYLNGLRLENLPNKLCCLKSLRTLSLKNCHNLCQLPDNVSRLSSLKKFVLDGSHVETLPGSIKDLPNLKTLSVIGCTRLRSLPELPSSIRHLKALDCTLLQTVSFWLITSGLQEKKRINISFQNCVNLDVERCIYSFLQYVRELAYRCELRRRGGKEKGIVWRSDFFKICYPDCRVPEWFTYRTMGASITFEVATPANYYFSSLLCVVLSSYSLDYELDIKCRCYVEDGNMHKYSFGISFLNHIPAEGNSDHVYMAYNYGGIFDVIKLDRLNNQIASSGYNPKVTFEFFVSRGATGYNQDDNLLIKECGVYPLNAPDYCIKQMELELGMKNKALGCS